MEGNRLLFRMPLDVPSPEGAAELHGVGDYSPQVTRCEGFVECRVGSGRSLSAHPIPVTVQAL